MREAWRDLSELPGEDLTTSALPEVAGWISIYEELASVLRSVISRANGSPDSWLVRATGEGWRAEYSLSRLGFVVGWLHIALSRRGWLGAFAIVVAVWALMTIWQSEEP